MNRKLLSAGVVALVLMVLFIAGLIIGLNGMRDRPGSIGHREPLPGFGYCSSKQSKPCVLSFNLDPGGGMLINVLTDTLQDFYIEIKSEAGEHKYECKRARKYSVNVTCTGEAMPVGETLNFLVISTKENATLAQGNFSIIGMALATPEIAITPTYVPAFDHRPK